MRKDGPKVKSNVREDKKVALIDVYYGPPNKNRFYALRSNGGQQ